ncbi:hypothetical protein IT072_07240 [Leifsonia sp. ZF2019]|uniref:hypothetical protein n=1 Tax=Leifsonia sp. ZF2019 TaxID=2781978 RepID=UPI001CC05527|nr:hypothetical protein [Leifsonia sp. ZF2019]UAJ80797.1 hypothetical protein IT072_07240 [Leifsonia sp. ZF2019]
MLQVSMVGRAFAEIDATLITIDDGAILCWAETPGPAGVERAGAPVARYPVEQVLSIRVSASTRAAGSRGRDGARTSSRSDPEHPNAFRRWTAEQEDEAVAAFHRGDSFDEIARAVGRRVGGVRARLIALGVIEAGPTDRLRFPGAPAVAAAGASSPRALLRVIDLPRSEGRSG